MTAADRILTALERAGRPVQRREQHAARSQCPAHDGQSADSLSVRSVEGQALVWCFGGCTTPDVMAALGLTMADLYDTPGGISYDYTDPGGSVLRTVSRRHTGLEPKSRFRQRGTTKGPSTLYRLPQVLDAVAAGLPVYVVEGEKDVHALEAAGAVATTSPQGASNWHLVDTTPLHGADVRLVPDLDDAGARYALAVRASLIGHVRSLTELRPAAGKDAADHVAAGHGLDDLLPAAVPGTTHTGRAEPGTARTPSAVPGSRAVPGTVPDPPLYFDVAALLDGTLPEPPEPEVLTRSDGRSIFYSGQVNLVFGDPESGKTFVCLAAGAECLARGGRLLVLDLDHNGPASTVARLVTLGAPVAALRNPDRFRFVEPDDRWHVLAVVEDASTWRPDVAVVDSVGELLPVFGASSNSPDDYTAVHSAVLKPLATAGAAVICVDHLAKNTDSRAQGATGTAAKRRTIGGVSLRVRLADTFVPGKGGSAHLLIHKDRHGGLRQHSPTEDREPLAGTFVLTADGPSSTTWRVTAPTMTDRNPDEAADPADLAAVAALDPPARTVADVAERLRWRKQRAGQVLREHRRTTVPGSAPPVCVVPGTAAPPKGKPLPSVPEPPPPGTPKPRPPSLRPHLAAVPDRAREAATAVGKALFDQHASTGSGAS